MARATQSAAAANTVAELTEPGVGRPHRRGVGRQLDRHLAAAGRERKRDVAIGVEVDRGDGPGHAVVSHHRQPLTLGVVESGVGGDDGQRRVERRPHRRHLTEGRRLGPAGSAEVVELARQSVAGPPQLPGGRVDRAATRVGGHERGDGDPVVQHRGGRPHAAFQPAGVGTGARADRALRHGADPGTAGGTEPERGVGPGVEPSRRARDRTAPPPARSARRTRAGHRSGTRCYEPPASPSRPSRPPARTRCHR